MVQLECIGPKIFLDNHFKVAVYFVKIHYMYSKINGVQCVIYVRIY